MLGPQQCRFLNVTYDVSEASAWNHEGWDKLWLYNLHYFDDLNAAEAEQRVNWHRGLVARWVAENSPGVGNGWEPYTLSLRIVNWMKWALAGNSMESDWLESLALQLRWLRSRLEWHLLGNHLWANAKALVFGGLFFEGDEADAWLVEGLAIIERELAEQVLEDGGHFERSPMYHAIVVGDLLDLVNAAAAWPGRISSITSTKWVETAESMLLWLRGMSHPDGRIGFFNDAAFDIAPDYAALAEYAAHVGVLPAPETEVGRILKFPQTGYVRLEQKEAICLLDVAPVGPDYLPGHAHADTLSFELSVYRQRIIVNGGTSRYGAGAERLRERGTAAHSTVQIDGADSSEVWGGFRVARRAHPFGLEVEETPDCIDIACAHDGYRRLDGRPVHRRRWHWSDGLLEVVDVIEGGFREAVARFHLHPDVSIERNGNRGYLRLPSGRLLRWQVPEGQVAVAGSIWCPEFGLSVSTQCLEVRFLGPSVRTRFSWN
ncbi:MAG: alginate lyase family protein [Pseudomonadota bacterium]